MMISLLSNQFSLHFKSIIKSIIKSIKFRLLLFIASSRR